MPAPRDETEQFNRFLKACVSLAGHPDFETIRSYFQTRLISISLGNNKTPDDLQTRWKQGRCQELAELIGFMRAENADQLLRKRTAPPPAPQKIE